MKIGGRRWSIIGAAVLGVVAVEIIAQYQKTPGLGVASAGALIGMVAGYCGFDAQRKNNNDPRDLGDKS